MSQPYKIQQQTVKDLEEKLSSLQPKLTAGEGIAIEGNVISATNTFTVEDASETTKGIIRIATMNEAMTGVEDTVAITPLKAKSIVSDYTGKVVQLRFNGTLTGDTLTFEPNQEPYVVKAGYEYEVDLLYSAADVLPDTTKMVIKNGEETITLLNVKDADASTSMTYGAMKQMCRYDAGIGWRWVFNARYSVTDTGVKVLVMPSTVIDDSKYVTTDTDQIITAGKVMTNVATATSTESHTGMSLTLKNTVADITSTTTGQFNYQGVRFVDKNNEETGFLYNAPNGTGGTLSRLGASAKVNGQYVDGFVQVGVDSTGKAHCYIPEVDEANNNGVQAATVNYVKKSLGTKQDTLTAGTGISIQDNVISSTVNSATWGNITGTLTDQTDLKEALDAKQPTGDYATTAQLPTKVSQLTNDAGYITSAQVPAGLTVSYSSASEELVFTSDSTLQASLANIISGE